MEAGPLRGSFLPPKPLGAPRTLTRERKTQLQERQREANRLHKALEDTGIKLDGVAGDIPGASGRAMLDALVAGTTEPAVLAALAKGKLRAKPPQLREALEGRFASQHALVIGAILAHRTSSTSTSTGSRTRSRNNSALSPRASRRRPRSPASPKAPPRSWSPRSAPTWAAFPPPDTWPRVPDAAPAAGTRRSGRRRKGSTWLAIALEEAALATTRTKGSYPHAQYQRLRPRSGHGIAYGQRRAVQ